MADNGLKRGFLEGKAEEVPETAAAFERLLEKDLAECARLREVKNDDSTPYASRYDERELLQRLRKVCDRARDCDGERRDLGLKYVAIIDVLLGANFMETEETGPGFDALTRAEEALRPDEPAHVLACVDAANHLGMVFSARGDYDDAVKSLMEAKDTYDRAGKDLPAPRAPLGDDLDAAIRLERLHTQTLFYLAQVHGHNGDGERSAVFCHATLRRQLEGHTTEHEPHEWCKNALQLATYYINHDSMAVAEHCLAAAGCVMDTIPGAQRVDGDGAVAEKDGELQANVHLAWAELWRAVLRRAAEVKKDDEGLGGQAGARFSLEGGDLRFDLLRLPEASTECVDPRSVRSFDEAREVYKRGARRVRDAKAYFRLDGFVSDHYACANLDAQLLAALVPFERDPRRVIAMHKRRASLLQPILDSISHKAFHGICRQMMFDLGSIYDRVLDVKVALHQNADGDIKTRKLMATVQLCDKYLTMFTESFRTPEGTLPPRVEVENEEVFLTAYFTIGRAYGKLTTPEAVGKSLKAYEAVVAYADKNDVACLAEEIGLAREMVALLPSKLRGVEGK